MNFGRLGLGPIYGLSGRSTRGCKNPHQVISSPGKTFVASILPLPGRAAGPRATAGAAGPPRCRTRTRNSNFAPPRSPTNVGLPPRLEFRAPSFQFCPKTHQRAIAGPSPGHCWTGFVPKHVSETHTKAPVNPALATGLPPSMLATELPPSIRQLPKLRLVMELALLQSSGL